MPSKRFESCILHIGTEKTGTKAIQHYLGQNRRSLKRAGILYPMGANAEHASQWEFVATVHNEPWKQDVGRSFEIRDEQDQLRFSEKLAKSLEREFEKSPRTNTLLISSEHFQSRLLNVAQIDRLKNWLGQWADQFKIVVFFRRQDQLSLSLLSTRLKSSLQFNIQNLQEVMRNPPHYFDYLKIYENWANVFGASSIQARLYEERAWKNGSLIEEFNHACGIPDLDIPPNRFNQSLNRQGFQFLHALNKLFPITPGDRSDPNRAALVRKVSELCAGKYYPINKAQAEAFYREYVSSNETLRSRAFPDYSAPLFDEDFSEYPERVENETPTYAEAIEIAVKLWQSTNYTDDQRASIMQKLTGMMKPKTV